MQFYRPALLDPQKHNRDGFSCGDSSLDEYLQKYAGQNRRGNNAAIWVIADERYRVVCYATLSMSSVDRSAPPRPLAKGAPPSVPALLVGRLGTDESVSGLGLGTQMVRHILATAVDLNLRRRLPSGRRDGAQLGSATLVGAFRFRPLRRSRRHQSRPVPAHRRHPSDAARNLNIAEPVSARRLSGGATTPPRRLRGAPFRVPERRRRPGRSAAG